MAFWVHKNGGLFFKSKKPSAVENLSLSLLTQKESEVYKLLVQGLTLKQTAERLGVKYSTVNTHTTSIYKKLGVNSRASLIIKFHNYEYEKENL